MAPRPFLRPAVEFLSTPSARRATISGAALGSPGRYFYPRPPRGGRRHADYTGPSPSSISIHALREEGDLMMLCSSISAILFLSTPSARRATKDFTEMPQTLAISIHALREEGDGPWLQRQGAPGYFYPRPPRGGRRRFVIELDENDRFLSTPSARRATEMLPEEEDDHAISIHALREEGDRKKPVHDKIAGRFLSTPSARRATDYRLVRLAKFDISIHALREEGDSKNRDKISIFKQIIQHSARI